MQESAAASTKAIYSNGLCASAPVLSLNWPGNMALDKPKVHARLARVQHSVLVYITNRFLLKAR